MKTFTEYLTESKQTYSYRVKVAGGCEKDCLKALEDKLSKYDLITMSDPKTTPVQTSCIKCLKLAQKNLSHKLK